MEHPEGMSASTSQTFAVPLPDLRRVSFEEAWEAHRARVFHWALRYGAGDRGFAERSEGHTAELQALSDLLCLLLP